MSELSKVTDADFKETAGAPGLTLIDFSATWCGPCKRLHPILAEIQAERPELRIVTVDIEEAPQAALACGVMSVPQVHFFKDGAPVDKFIAW